MKIVICDDDYAELTRISLFLDHYRMEKNVSIIYKTFHSALELLCTMKNTEYDLLLLDILMPGLDGIQAAREIRQYNKCVKIVFLTCSPEFAIESYTVKAYDYILKPATQNMLYLLLDTLRSEEVNIQEGITLKTQKSIVHILFSNLTYVEVINKKLYFHMLYDEVLVVNASLSEVADKLLCRPEFIKVHRSYIVNLWQINILTSRELITHDGITIPISRLLYAKVRDAYMNLIFQEEGI